MNRAPHESSGAVGRDANPPRSDEQYFFAGFTFSGNQNLDALAGFYGLAVPALEPQITLAEYLARTCYGSPSAGYRVVFGRVELIVRELEEGTISKVGLRLLPQGSSQRRRRLPVSAGHNIGASLIRRHRSLPVTAARSS